MLDDVAGVKSERDHLSSIHDHNSSKCCTSRCIESNTRDFNTSSHTKARNRRTRAARKVGKIDAVVEGVSDRDLHSLWID